MGRLTKTVNGMMTDGMLNLHNDYSNRKNAIWLQRCGWSNAKPAQDFSIGEYFKWNTGSISKIVGIIKETKAFIAFKTAYAAYGGGVDFFERRLKKSRLVAIGTPCEKSKEDMQLITLNTERGASC